MIVKIEQLPDGYWVELEGRELGVFQYVYINGKPVKREEWEYAYIDASQVYVDDGAVYVYTIVEDGRDIIDYIAEVLKHDR